MKERIIYHYCSMDSFFGILTNRKIRLSNAYKTNDKDEMEFIFRIMEESLNAYFEKEFVSSLRNSYRSSLEHHFRPHIACFSKNGDLLSQWRAYANDGKGISIGFNREYFESIKMLDNKEFEICDVVYKRKKQLQLLSDLVSEIGEDKFRRLVEHCINKGDQFYSLEFEVLASILLKYGMTFKNETFSEEKEIRLIHGFDMIIAEPDMFEYRVTLDDLISFVEIPIDIENGFEPIYEIILGPNCKVNPLSLEHFLGQKLSSKSIGIEIKKSKSSYRV